METFVDNWRWQNPIRVGKATGILSRRAAVKTLRRLQRQGRIPGADRLPLRRLKGE